MVSALEGLKAWEAAQKMVHDYVPDPESDREYLDLVHRAAEADLKDALLELGNIAVRRDEMVEAYYWMDRAAQRGSEQAMCAKDEIRRAWAASGCPKGRISQGFGLRQAECIWQRMHDELPLLRGRR